MRVDLWAHHLHRTGSICTKDLGDTAAHVRLVPQKRGGGLVGIE